MVYRQLGYWLAVVLSTRDTGGENPKQNDRKLDPDFSVHVPSLAVKNPKVPPVSRLSAGRVAPPLCG
jgi:hypothetical protein